jgi:exodeoxyribonuclease-3
MRISTWNVNGLRATVRNGFEQWLRTASLDVACLQEVKLQEDLLTDVWFPGFEPVWNTGRRSGYAGVATLLRDGIAPLAIERGIGHDDLDNEGRVLLTELPHLLVLNVYAPHSHRKLTRLQEKLTFGRHLLDYLRHLRRREKPLLLLGDLNVAHTELDLANAKQNAKNAGFLPEERAWFDALLGCGFVDAFRQFEKAGGQYTWWSPRAGVRERNVGWRLDYALVDHRLLPNLRGCFHSPEQLGSDHCPVTVELEF